MGAGSIVSTFKAIKMEKLADELSQLSLGDKLGYLKQPKGFATKSIHAAQEPERWTGR